MSYIFSRSGGAFLITNDGNTVYSGNGAINFNINNSKIEVWVQGSSPNSFYMVCQVTLDQITSIGGVSPAGTIEGVILQLNGLISAGVVSSPNFGTINTDAGGRTRVSQLTTLHDGKILNGDNSLMFDNVGTGTGLYGLNKYNMSVTAGQYFIRQTTHYMPYSSGKSQLVEETFTNFQTEAGVIKRVGYFSSNAVAPYASAFDGFFIENNEGVFSLKAYRKGVLTINTLFTAMDNYTAIADYNWANFTVIAFDFLWLGGAVIRFFVKTANGFELIHTENYSGTADDVFILSPNQPLRYEIRSTTGAGSFQYVCSQGATEGAIDESGYNVSLNSLSTAGVPSVTLASIGTVYPIMGIRKRAGFRDTPSKFIGLTMEVSSNTDLVIWSVQINPTLATPLTYNINVGQSLEQANSSTVAGITNTVTAAGKVIASGVCRQSSGVNFGVFEKDFNAFLGSKIDDTSDQLVLCAQPVTTTVSLNATLTMKEY